MNSRVRLNWHLIRFRAYESDSLHITESATNWRVSFTCINRYVYQTSKENKGDVKQLPLNSLITMSLLLNYQWNSTDCYHQIPLYIQLLQKISNFGTSHIFHIFNLLFLPLPLCFKLPVWPSFILCNFTNGDPLVPSHKIEIWSKFIWKATEWHLSWISFVIIVKKT